jgi:hypothetical protein
VAAARARQPASRCISVQHARLPSAAVFAGWPSSCCSRQSQPASRFKPGQLAWLPARCSNYCSSFTTDTQRNWWGGGIDARPQPASTLQQQQQLCRSIHSSSRSPAVCGACDNLLSMRTCCFRVLCGNSSGWHPQLTRGHCYGLQPSQQLAGSAAHTGLVVAAVVVQLQPLLRTCCIRGAQNPHQGLLCGTTLAC